MPRIAARIIDCAADLCLRQQPGRRDGRLAGCCSRSSTCWSAGYPAWLCCYSAGTWPRMLSCWCSGTRTRSCAGAPTGSGTSQRTGCGSPRWHGCSRAGAGPESSPSRPRRCWPGTAGWPRASTTRAIVFQAAGARILRTAVQVRRMNAICERLAGTLRREILDRVLILGEAYVHTVLTEYQAQLQHGPAAPGHRPARPQQRTMLPRHHDRRRHRTDPPKTASGCCWQIRGHPKVRGTPSRRPSTPGTPMQRRGPRSAFGVLLENQRGPPRRERRLPGGPRLRARRRCAAGRSRPRGAARKSGDLKARKTPTRRPSAPDTPIWRRRRSQPCEEVRFVEPGREPGRLRIG